MKKLVFTLALCVGSVTLVNIPAAATTTGEEAIEAYEELLTEPYFNWDEREDSSWTSSEVADTSNYKFAYVDLNGDGVKELILECDSASHASGYYRILVYADGNAKIADSLSDFTWFEDAGIYKKEYSNTGHFSGAYYELRADGELVEKAAYEGQDTKPENGEVIYEKKFKEQDVSVYYTSCKIDGKEVSYKEYEKGLDELNLGEESNIVMLDNTAENREKYANGEVGNDYILPTSDSEYLTSDDLEGLSKSELRFARNEIFARHGRKFNDSSLQDYFDGCSWYKGTVAPDDFDEKVLNKYEKANVKLIKKMEDKSNSSSNKNVSKDVMWYCTQLTEDYISEMYMQDDGIFVLEGNLGEGTTQEKAEDAERWEMSLSAPFADDVTIIGIGGDDEYHYTKEEFIEDFIGNLNGLDIILKMEDGEFTEIYLYS